MPKFDGDTYQQYYNTRKRSQDIHIQEHGWHPYSYYLINKASAFKSVE